MKITIYQIVPELDAVHLLFMDFHTVQTACGEQVPAWLYQTVYSGELEARSLEDLFYTFNMQHPEGYKGRSMSVSDVVEVHDPDTGSVFYYREPVGFRQIEFDKNKISKSGDAQDSLQGDAAERIQDERAKTEL